MKGLSAGRLQLSITPGHGCVLTDCDHSLDHLQHGLPDPRAAYLLSPTESCPVEHHRCSPRSSIHSECTGMPVSVTSDPVSSSTFPRMHYSSHHEGGREDGSGPATGSGKMNRIPANLLDQFEKQLPMHRDGFHTLQYQRASATMATGGEQRSESPGRIRHLVHSVQKLFTKSHSLEGSSKMNGTKGDSRSDGGHHHHGGKRNKSKERKADSRYRSGITTGWWSSDDNLDSDSTYRTPSIMSHHHVDHVGHCYPDSFPGHFGDLSLKISKSNNDVKCSACESVAPEGKFMKRSSWSTLTVSQAKEAYRKSSLNLEKPGLHPDLKSSMRPCHYLQVPQDEWGSYPCGKDEEIPCRRMRSSSYVKAMGDEESGDSDGSPKDSPQKSMQPPGLIKSVLHRQLSDQSQSYHLQASRDIHPSITLDPSPNYNSPKFRSRNQSYMRAVSTLSQVSEAELNGQFESVCESVFSEVESQAMEALDLPGCFRTRSHSYLRAIQAGYSQDDDCVPSMTSSAVRSAAGELPGNVTPLARHCQRPQSASGLALTTATRRDCGIMTAFLTQRE
uniref:Discs, large (Drosophila) homolog-associated protein 2a n=1 Tax=Electrophorus electricus TaxID=8005 RepID=A0A4W4DNU5_ELEEL